MSDDHTAPEEAPDTPTPTEDAPDTGQAPEAEETEAVDLDNFDLAQIPEDADRQWFEEKYNALRSDYSRKTQRIAETRKQAEQKQAQADAIFEAVRNPNHPDHSRIMEELGLEEVSDEPDDDFEDDPHDRRLSALEQRLEAEAQAKAEQARAAQLEDILTDRIDTVQNREGIEFTPEELKFLVNAAAASPDDQGMPDIDAAYRDLKKVLATRQKSWLESKKAPRSPGRGLPASRELDITNRDERLAQTAAAVEAAMNRE